jgi:hypothetical protein
MSVIPKITSSFINCHRYHTNNKTLSVTFSGTGAAICTGYSSAMQRQMIVLPYLGIQCTKFHAATWTCCFFTSFHLESCIWSDAISQWIRQRYSIQVCAILGKSTTETVARSDIQHFTFTTLLYLIHDNKYRSLVT